MKIQINIFLFILFISTNVFSQTELINAIRNFKPETAITLINNGADVNEYLAHKEEHTHTNKCTGHEFNRSPLFWAVLRCNYNVADLLLQKGAKINFKNAHGKTALHMAVQKYDIKMVELLLKNKANINSVDDKGNTPIMLATYNYSIETNHKVKNNIKEVIKLLIKNKANLNIKNNQNKKPNDFEIIQLLTK